ncbi:MAG: ParB/RepB/Spo0J family partition protein [Thermodesulfobacteriota bacterium]
MSKMMSKPLGKRSPLGKGLGALLPSQSEDRDFFLCAIDTIAPNPSQPRKRMDDTALHGLAESIREKGVLLPLVVRQTAEEMFEIIAGERRWRAAKLAGLDEVPVLVKDVSPLDQLEMALVENIQRQDLNPLEEAEAYLRLVNEFNLTQDEVAKRVGKERSTVANALRINHLPDFAKEDLASGMLTMGHARVLLSLPDEESMREARDLIMEKGLNVRQAEELVRQKKNKPVAVRKPVKRARQQLSESYCKSFTSNLGKYLETRVRLVQNGNRGKVEIEYASSDDLERLMARIVRAQ